MTRGQLIGIGIGFGLSVGLLAGWAIGTTVAVKSLTSLLRDERDRSETAEQEAGALRLKDRSHQETSAELKYLQTCAAIRVDVKDEKGEAVFYIGGKKVPRDDLQKVLAEAVTWDGKPDLLVILENKDHFDKVAATVEEAARDSRKFSLPPTIITKTQGQ